MTLIKFITFPRPVSPAQLPAATDEALSISTSKLLRSQHPAAHRGPGHRSTPGWFTWPQTSPHLPSSLASSWLCFLLLLTCPLGEQAPLPPPPLLAIRSAPGVPRLPVLESQGQGQAGVGTQMQGSVHPIAVLSFATQAWKGHS